MGDESPQYRLSKNMIEKAIEGEKVQFEEISAEDLLTDISKEWNVFHLLLEEGYYARRYLDKCRKQWRELYGQHVLYVSDISKISEIITSTIQLVEGEDKDRIIKSWDGTTSLAVQHAFQGIDKFNSDSTELVEF